MAWRFDQAVIRGELDNTQPGRVQVRLEVLGREEPIFLDLAGNAWRDIAGSRLHFVNPSPKAQFTLPPGSGVKTGHVGDITASRKVKVFTVPEEEWKAAYREGRIDTVPTEIRNSLYLEWFSDEDGRCVVESADFEIEVTEHVWQMDEDEEAAQKMANLHAMREYLADIIQRPSTPDDGSYDDELRQEDFTEEKWEEQLKASDRLNDASMEAHDKYDEDEESEEKIAYVMGWDHLIEDMADFQEGVQPSENDSPEKKRRREWMEAMNEACQAAEEENEDAEDDEEDEIADELSDDDEELDEDDGFDTVRNHPLNQQSRAFIRQIFDEMKSAGIQDIREPGLNHPLDRFITHAMQICGKLAAATSMIPRRKRQDGVDTETGHVLALTKRCLNWANEALAALQELSEDPGHAEHVALFQGWQTELFSLRDGITDLRRDLQAG